METSDKPFPQAVEDLLREREWSLRELQRRTQEEGKWGSLSTIHQLLSGGLRPSYEAMEHVARALRVRPEYFAEFRLAKAQRELDWERVGLKRALRNLDQRA